MQTRRLLIKPSVTITVVGVMLVLAAATALGSSTSGWVKYFGPTQYGGSYHCAKVRADMNTGTNPIAYSRSSSWSGSACGNLVNVPSGYLGAQVHLVKGDGTLCGSTAWEFNSGSAAEKFSGKFLFQTSCPQHNASYKSEAHAQYWKTNTNSYVTSSWVSSPYQNIP